MHAHGEEQAEDGLIATPMLPLPTLTRGPSCRAIAPLPRAAASHPCPDDHDGVVWLIRTPCAPPHREASGPTHAASTCRLDRLLLREKNLMKHRSQMGRTETVAVAEAAMAQFFLPLARNTTTRSAQGRQNERSLSSTSKAYDSILRNRSIRRQCGWTTAQGRNSRAIKSPRPGEPSRLQQLQSKAGKGPRAFKLDHLCLLPNG